jgi:hypothetical protein
MPLRWFANHVWVGGAANPEFPQSIVINSACCRAIYPPFVSSTEGAVTDLISVSSRAKQPDRWPHLARTLIATSTTSCPHDGLAGRYQCLAGDHSARDLFGLSISSAPAVSSSVYEADLTVASSIRSGESARCRRVARDGGGGRDQDYSTQ